MENYVNDNCPDRSENHTQLESIFIGDSQWQLAKKFVQTEEDSRPSVILQKGSLVKVVKDEKTKIIYRHKPSGKDFEILIRIYNNEGEIHIPLQYLEQTNIVTLIPKDHP